MSSGKRSRPSITSASATVPEKKKCEELQPSVSVTEFYGLEDRLAMSLEMSDIQKSFIDNSNRFRQEISDFCTVNAQSPDRADLVNALLVRFITLRRLNRFAQFRNRKIRDRVNQERASVEEKFIKLQNINNEIEHLNKEIDRCYDFRSADEDISLVPISEFYKNAPASISREETTKNDPHILHLSRLNWELSERKILVGTLQEREGRKNVLISDITTKQHRLKSLKPKIEAIIEVAAPVQELMGLNPCIIDSENQRILSLLAKELSVIAVQIEAYCDIVRESGIKIKCKGDYESAIKYIESRQNLLNEVEEDDEKDKAELDSTTASQSSTETVKRRRTTISDQIAKRKEAIITPHPIFLEIEISCQEKISVTLILQFVDGLCAVGTQAKLDGVSNSNHKRFFAEDNFLTNLQPGDDGNHLSNVALSKLNQMRLTVPEVVNKTGRFYKFMQQMAGIDGCDSSGSQISDIIYSFVKQLRSRIHARNILSQSTQFLHSLKLFELMSSEERKFFPAKICSKLCEFRTITAEQYMNHPLMTSSHKSFIKLEQSTNTIDDHFYFSAIAERDANAKLIMLIHVDVTYPDVTPIFLLSITLNGIIQSSKENTSLCQLERAVNMDFASFVKLSDNCMLLQSQMAFIVSRFDILLESSAEFEKEHLCVRFAKGRDRQLPLYYNSTSNTFTFGQFHSQT